MKGERCEMVDLDKAISETAYILECIATLKSIQELGDCNTCGVKGCQYRPDWGKPVRYNCPFYERRQE